MFKQAKIQLSFFYSILFLITFWVFSLGIYFWMEKSIGEGVILNEVKQQYDARSLSKELDDQRIALAATAGDVSLSQLRTILLYLNGGLLILVPLSAWFLTRKTLEPVQKIHEQQKQFVSDASHELRTPLSIISGEIEVALKKNRSAQDYQQILKSTKEEINSLTGLVENLLFLARDDQGKQKMEREKVDLIDLISFVTASLKTKSNSKKQTISFNPPKESLEVRGNPILLKQLFSNILDNAIKYTPKKGKIWIEVFRKAQFVVIKIKDSGIGISPEDQKKIFERFYRVDTSRSQVKGYGLGLAIANGVVEKHQGQIIVESTLDKGTTFTVFLLS